MLTVLHKLSLSVSGRRQGAKSPSVHLFIFDALSPFSSDDLWFNISLPVIFYGLGGGGDGQQSRGNIPNFTTFTFLSSFYLPFFCRRKQIRRNFPRDVLILKKGFVLETHRTGKNERPL